MMNVKLGTLWTASAHVITAVIGSGVFSLAWAAAQLGWVPGVSSFLRLDCYRFPKDCTYINNVKACLGGIKHKLCELSQYITMVVVPIGYTITASISMVALG
ncbi:amino acid permease 8-like, partial [Euphorbia lathyris]|uniref:amino acid permease 8-like n=1 Tax=Euphorbia lathyris TaxID=212925 RepID=UPI0033144827